MEAPHLNPAQKLVGNLVGRLMDEVTEALRTLSPMCTPEAFGFALRTAERELDRSIREQVHHGLWSAAGRLLASATCASA